MTITATELKKNLGKYLETVSEEDVLITKNGKVIAHLVAPNNNKIEIYRSLVGIASEAGDISLDDIKNERLSRQWECWLILMWF